jgi:hypothetical protein
MTTRHARAGVACIVLLLAACSGGSRSDGPAGGVHTIAIEPQSAALCVGDSVTLTAQATDADGHPVSGVALSWASSAPEVIAVGPSSAVAHALATGSAAVTASAQGVTSNRAAIDVPADLVPEFVPDSVVLAPGDTMTLGVRLRRVSGGPAPSHTPVFTPFDSTVASLDASGLVHAKASGRTGLSLSACGRQGGGAVDVFTPSDAVTGKAYLWLSGPVERRLRMPARLINFTRHNGAPAVQVSSVVGPAASPSQAFVYEDTVRLTGTGTHPVDSLTTTELINAQPNVACSPPRPSAFYTEPSPLTLLVSLTGGSARVTTFTSQSTFTAVSGRMLFRMRGVVSGGTQLDTLSAIYTFSAPLVDSTGACP